MSVSDLIALGLFLFTAVGVIVGVLQARSEGRRSRLSERVQQIELWEAEIKRLSDVCERQEKELDALRDKNRVLTDVVTGREAITALTEAVNNNHQAVMTELSRIGAAAGGPQ